MVVSTVYDFCARHSVQNTALLVAVSGGSDSTALFHSILHCRERLGLAVVGVAHVNHGMRPDDAAREAAFVSGLAEKNRCAFHYVELFGKKRDDAGAEVWARTERYRFFSSLQQQHGYRFVATGHTMDDQAETVLMRIARGSGGLGLCGIHPVREDGVIRPLLALRRNTLREWLKAQGHPWCEDPSNAELRYLRNRIRHRILPELVKYESGTVENCAACAAHLLEQRAFLAPLVQRWLDVNLCFRKASSFALARDGMREDHFLASEGIVRLFREYAITFDRATIERVHTGALRRSGTFLLKDGWRFFPGKERIEFQRWNETDSAAALEVGCALCVPSGIETEDGWEFTLAEYTHDRSAIRYDQANWTVYLDGEKVGTTLLYRMIEKKDVMQPLGSLHEVNCRRFLKKEQISSHFRKSQGVVVDNDGRPVWIPGVAIAHHCRITEQTKKIFQFTCRRIPSLSSI